ncbi:MAG TPA: purine-nucleoside phosphorylase [Ignavibacteria bacterium]|nr:purine-nucleoside phosphorylase [Ignavibacteria bacterium]
MIDLNFKYKEIITILAKSFSKDIDIAIILGSGLGGFADSVNIVKTVSTTSLPGYPPSTIPGHEGKIHLAEYKGKTLLLFQGRIHFYEGYHISQCILPAFIAVKLNCKKLFITNAAGGISPNLNPGDLMLIESFNGISIKYELTQLIGLASFEGKEKFLNSFLTAFKQTIIKAALEEKIRLNQGVYWFTKGPSYETPAEIKMMAKFGADAVGMSTVPEAAFAAYLGMDVAAVSCITNFAAGITKKKLNHSEVTETANLVKDKFERLVKRMIMLI